MRIDTGQHLRLDQRMKLAPRMIQSMEILQLASQALEERIEQELAKNPTLELTDDTEETEEVAAQVEQEKRDTREGERELIVPDDAGERGHAEDFERLGNISEEYGDSWGANTYETGEDYRPARVPDGERDAKLDAMANTAARPESLTDQLLDQWRLVETTPPLRAAGEYLLGFIDDDGYLRADQATLQAQLPPGMTQAELDTALALIQKGLEPVGVGARDLRECLLLQIDAKIRQLEGQRRHEREHSPATGNGRAANGHHAPVNYDEVLADLALARLLVSDYLKDIEVNRLPKIAAGTGLTLEEIKDGIAALRQFHPHPGRMLVEDSPRTITPDATVEYDDAQDRYVARLTHERLPSLSISQRYLQMARDRQVDRKTREFVSNNLREARWLIEAIQQRHSTLLRVINVVIDAQREFFDQGPQHLKPLPMTLVADQLGIHVATVSRAVSEKYLQTPRGILPLRMFFSGGTKTEAGEDMSWGAVQAKLEEIIAEEDKSNPLNDDELVVKLKEKGIEIARRTVAKYRKQLQIAPARQRKQF